MEILLAIIVGVGVAIAMSSLETKAKQSTPEYKKYTADAEQTQNIYHQKQKEYDIVTGKGKEVRLTYNSRLLFSNEKKKIFFYEDDDTKGKTKAKEFDFKDLISVEYSENNQIVGSASTSGAIVGGVLGGATGAIIGATTGEKEYYRTKLTLCFNDFDFPVIAIEDVINYKSLMSSVPVMKERFQQAYGLCEFIINQNKINSQQ